MKQLATRHCLVKYFVCVAALVSLGLSNSAPAQTQAPNSSSQKEAVVHHASGPFEVKVTPLNDKSDGPSLGRMGLDKQYHGDMEATANGQMLTAGSVQKGAGGYVAMEKVTGTLQGRSGSFVLQHSGTMKGSARELTITIVPESGTGQLEGISGQMTIKIAPDGKHSYELDYTLPTYL
jgi:hypothetical protein